jgi:hypothetical protein
MTAEEHCHVKGDRPCSRSIPGPRPLTPLAPQRLRRLAAQVPIPHPARPSMRLFPS